MHDESHEHETVNGQPLLVTAHEAAQLLNVSEKTLWNHSAPRGLCIPVVRFGKTLRYSRAALEQWIAQQVGRTSRADEG